MTEAGEMNHDAKDSGGKATTPLHLLLAWGFVGVPLLWGVLRQSAMP